MRYREPDSARGAEHAAQEAADQAEVDGARKAFRRTWDARRMRRTVLLVVLALPVLGAVAFLAVYLSHRGRCVDRCVGTEQAEVCVDERPRRLQCKTPCATVDPQVHGRPMSLPCRADPAEGAPCYAADCDESFGFHARGRECTPDRRRVLECSGCPGLWRLVDTCNVAEMCGGEHDEYGQPITRCIYHGE